jgi:hypothetical protein
MFRFIRVLWSISKFLASKMKSCLDTVDIFFFSEVKKGSRFQEILRGEYYREGKGSELKARMMRVKAWKGESGKTSKYSSAMRMDRWEVERTNKIGKEGGRSLKPQTQRHDI